MQHLYVLRRFSGWSSRLGASVALLLGGAGLAASLLVGAALGKAATAQPGWKPALDLPHITSRLATAPPATTQVLPVSLSSVGPAYTLAASPAYSAPPPAPASSSLSDPAADATPDLLTAASTVKMTVQRSWRTFKLAFR